jgi:polyisoprenoid-binding protein YceI
MTRSILTLLALSLITLGCSNEGTMSATSNDATAVADPADVGPGEPAAADGDLAAAPLDNDATSSTSASADTIPQPSSTGREVALSPENTQIRFVGLHTGDEPNPREGTFEAFQGKAVIQGTQLASLEVTIDTTTVTTPIDRLTNHLKSADFFDVNEYPQATFRSTSITPDTASGSKVTVTGDLTLHGVTKSISFPATVLTDGGLNLNAEFSIDRTEFGMTYGEERVVNEVSLTVAVDA